MREQASRFGTAELSRAADILNDGCTEMRGATSPRLLLELITARLLLPGAAHDGVAVLSRVERLERRMSIDSADNPAPSTKPAATAPAPSAPEPPAAPPAAAAEQPAPPRAAKQPAPPRAAKQPAPPRAAEQKAPPVAAAPPVETAAAPATHIDEASGGSVDAAALRRVWPEVLEATKARKRTAHAMLAQYAQVTDVRGRTIVLSFAHPPIERQFRAQGLGDVLSDALREVLGVVWTVETVAGADEPRKEAETPTAEGFDAGDAPTDGEATIDITAPSGEDAAVALLEEGLGATVIGEVDAS
jgi:DNA polymerase-3 subunit gamma/tau